MSGDYVWLDRITSDPAIDDLVLALETYATVDASTDSVEESLASVGLADHWVSYIAMRLRYRPGGAA